MVLIVDDHSDTCLALQKLLTRAGVPADYVTSGPDAVGVIRSRKPDVVVLDVMMPDMNGIDVLRTIRSDIAYEQVAILMYSGDHTHSRMREAMREGAQGYLVKGTIGWDELVKEVRRFHP